MVDPVQSGDDSDDADITKSVPLTDSPPPRNPTTASDEEMAVAAFSDANLLNLSTQSVDVDQDLYTAERSVEASHCEFITGTRKKKR